MRVIIADEHAEVRSALRLLLEEIPDIFVAAETDTQEKLLLEVEKLCPDLILIDMELPGTNRKELLASINSRCPGVGVIALSSVPQMRQAALEAGIADFVCKSDPPESLLAVLDKYYHFKE
jgi:two-component system nitrate/nitrite response regulator NarL